jgi:hypothetical protein
MPAPSVPVPFKVLITGKVYSEFKSPGLLKYPGTTKYRPFSERVIEPFEEVVEPHISLVVPVVGNATLKFGELWLAVFGINSSTKTGVPQVPCAVLKFNKTVPAAVAFALMVILVPSIIEVIAALLGIPIPVTDIPTVKEVVDKIPVIVGDVNVVVPVNTIALNVKAIAVPVAVALALSVILVPSTTVNIVVPVGIPVPTTVIPAVSEAVEDIFVTVAVEIVVFPVKPLIAASAGAAFLNTHKYPSLNLVEVCANTLALAITKAIAKSIVLKKVIFFMSVFFLIVIIEN